MRLVNVLERDTKDKINISFVLIAMILYLIIVGPINFIGEKISVLESKLDHFLSSYFSRN